MLSQILRMERLVEAAAGNRKGWVSVGGVSKGGRQRHSYDGRWLAVLPHRP
jgi:hypothetical protein